MYRKPLEELEFSDDFMFMQVMSDTSICKQFIEAIFGKRIKEVMYHHVQDVISIEPESHGVRFDVKFVGDSNVYNIEMQKTDKKDIVRRVRYYQALLDSTLLPPGQVYENLPNTFIIFICAFDPFGEGYARYTQVPCIKEVGKTLRNGTQVIYLNSQYTPVDRYMNVSEDVRCLLDYIKSPKRVRFETKSPLVQIIEQSVQSNRQDADMRRGLMSLYDYLMDAKEEGKEEGKAELLQQLKELGIVPKDFKMPNKFGVKPMSLSDS